MAAHRRPELGLDALTLASRHRPPAVGLSHHADHGGPSTALTCGQCLQAAGLLPSLGSVGDWFANAVAERCFATLTVEWRQRQSWPTRAAARLASFA
jgi:putative transposase